MQLGVEEKEEANSSQQQLSEYSAVCLFLLLSRKLHYYKGSNHSIITHFFEQSQPLTADDVHKRQYDETRKQTALDLRLTALA